MLQFFETSKLAPDLCLSQKLQNTRQPLHPPKQPPVYRQIISNVCVCLLLSRQRFLPIVFGCLPIKFTIRYVKFQVDTQLLCLRTSKSCSLPNLLERKGTYLIRVQSNILKPWVSLCMMHRDGFELSIIYVFIIEIIQYRYQVLKSLARQLKGLVKEYLLMQIIVDRQVPICYRRERTFLISMGFKVWPKVAQVSTIASISHKQPVLLSNYLDYLYRYGYALIIV